MRPHFASRSDAPFLTYSKAAPESVLACGGSGRRKGGYKLYSFPQPSQSTMQTAGKFFQAPCKTGEKLCAPALQPSAPLPTGDPPSLRGALMGHWGADEPALVPAFRDCFHSGYFLLQYSCPHETQQDGLTLTSV